MVLPVNVEVGNFGAIRTQAVVNMPFSDSLRTRLAVMSNKKDGMVTNLVTGNEFDDIEMTRHLDFQLTMTILIEHKFN